MSGSRGSIPYNELQNPLFIHPSDGLSSLVIEDKLKGAVNYRTWRRNMEIGLSTKRKLAFVQGTLARPDDDPVKADQWDACNNLVIAWLLNSLSETIGKSVLYVQSARTIWLQLEKRFCVSNGSRKFSLNRDVFNLKQNLDSISEYYTRLRCIWEELDSIMMLPRINTISEEVAIFLSALATQREEQKLFQFLNGLDDDYSALRSQMLMSTSLPSLDEACSMLQQEEMQRELLNCDSKLSSKNYASQHEASALLGRNSDEVCSQCNIKGHGKDRCWQILGYPSWHPKSKRFPQKKGGKDGYRTFKGDNAYHKTVAQAQSSEDRQSDMMFTQQQIQQLLKLLPVEGNDEQDNFAARACTPRGDGSLYHYAESKG